MLKENAATFLDRCPLFPGQSCFPLSPESSGKVNKSGFPTSDQDQINMIFQILGTPSKEDMDFITDPKAVEYLKSFTHHKREDFKEIYPGSCSEAIDFLNKCLVFNPKKRITVDDALKHPLFSKLRDLNKEKIISKAAVILDFDNEGELSGERLRKLFLDEISIYTKKKY